MIPLRVKVEGFLSYAEKQLLNFDGARLWMLTGSNGSGKSTVFDAITVALYDTFRGHQHNASLLINQSRDNFLVEFDFCLGEDIYRAQRRVNRKGSGMRQIWHLSGPNSPRPGRGEALVAEGDEVDVWVTNNIRLNYEAFTASVLLQQGQSDALLNMKPKERHETLSQLIDLSSYVRLHKRAEAYWKKFDDLAEDRIRQLGTVTPVEPTGIDRLITQIGTLQSDLTRAQDELERIAALKVHAVRWSDLQCRQREMAEALAYAEELVHDANTIEEEAQRFAELNSVLPVLEKLLSGHCQLAELDEDISRYEAQAQQWGENIAVVTVERNKIWTNLESLQEQRNRYQAQNETAHEALEALNSDRLKLDQLDSLGKEVSGLKEVFTKFPPGLDQEIEQLQREVERLTELKHALPWLQQFVDARDTWKLSQKEELEFRKEVDDCEEKIAWAQTQEESLRFQLAQARADLAHWADATNRADWEYENAERHLNNLLAIEGQPNCPHCGQPLTPEHIERERQSLTEALNETEVARHTAHKAHSATLEHCGQVEQQWLEVTETLAELKNHNQTTTTKLRAAQKAQVTAQESASKALNQLPPTLVKRIVPDSLVDMAHAFQSEFPSAADLQSLQKELSSLGTKQHNLSSLIDQRQRREKVQAQYEAQFKKLCELEQAYPPERVSQIRKKEQDLRLQAEQARLETHRLSEELARANEVRTQIETQLDEAETQSREAQAKAREQAAGRDVLNQVVADQISQLPELWQPMAAELSEATLAGYSAEKDTLVTAPERQKALETARHDFAQLQRTAAQLQEEADKVPAEARLPIATLEECEGDARQRFNAADETLVEVRAQKQQLEELCNKRLQLEQERSDFARKAQLYRELTQLLGREGLQKHLLEQVEQAIVENANAILSRISEGLLRLEFETFKKGKKPEASEVVVYHRQIGAKPIPLRSLSGGQRFRVAVSLALGIGRYAAQEGQQVESVIIDEGFGSLDKAGRREMIDALHDLSNELRRIIVVSHQDEFAKDFSNRYDVQIQDGISRVTLATNQ